MIPRLSRPGCDSVFHDPLFAAGFSANEINTNLSRQATRVARIDACKKRIVIGRFNTKEEAAEAYNAAAKLYHGEFAVINSI